MPLVPAGRSGAVAGRVCALVRPALAGRPRAHQLALTGNGARRARSRCVARRRRQRRWPVVRTLVMSARRKVRRAHGRLDTPPPLVGEAVGRGSGAVMRLQCQPHPTPNPSTGEGNAPSRLRSNPPTFVSTGPRAVQRPGGLHDCYISRLKAIARRPSARHLERPCAEGSRCASRPHRRTPASKRQRQRPERPRSRNPHRRADGACSHRPGRNAPFLVRTRTSSVRLDERIRARRSAASVVVGLARCARSRRIAKAAAFGNTDGAG